MRIVADAALARFDVDVLPAPAPATSSYAAAVGSALASTVGVGGERHRLAPLLGLVFRRSTVRHPLLAGALGERLD